MPDDLAGQDTLVASWAALAAVSPKARLIRTDSAVGAIFPEWEPLNNVIVLGAPDTADCVAQAWRRRYADAGVQAWALWIPSRTNTFDGPDELTGIQGMRRDVTTLVMTAAITQARQPRADAGVMRASLDSALRAGDEPVPVAELGPPASAGVPAWVLVRARSAIASAWTCRHDADLGIYGVGTVPAWRRQGIGTALMRHLMAFGGTDGARSVSLQSTPMGRGLYESLGFVAVGRYEEWIPGVQP